MEDLALDPEDRADDAFRRIGRRLLTAIELTVDGTRQQIDPEFLHDLRVASRRTRAALSQLKHVFDPEQVAGFRAELKWIGDVTGPARDLDVFLLRWAALVDALGGPDRAALMPIQQRLVERRQEVQGQVVALLDSERFGRLVTEWGRFLAQEGGDGRHGSRTVLRVANRRIRKRRRRILAQGAAIGPDSPATDLHAMRLECKKLRYLLEMFRSLYPADEVSGLIRALKQFQDTLGDFNDLAIQERLLAEIAAVEPASDRALERLIASLADRQAQLRQLFAGRFGRFAGEEVQATFGRLFD